MDRYACGNPGLARLALLAIIACPLLANAQSKYDYGINQVGKAIVVDQPDPEYPANDVRRGQEGWVRASFVVTPDGRAIDPVILDSSGGGGFEVEARKAIAGWRFEAGELELPYNFVDIRSEIRRGRDAATSNFMRRTKRILTHLYREENEYARTQADNTHKLGGWNLYESTMLWLMMGRVEGAEGDHAEKLEMYNRALAMGNANAIPADDRIELLEKIFLLQSHFQQHSAAAQTWDRLSKLDSNEQALARNEERAAEILAKLSSDDVITARATLSNPCNCEEGEPLWHYVPSRRTFSFDNADGNVERFEARCEGQRISGPVGIGENWTLEPGWGSCRVIVFGDDGATFDFLEHRNNDDDPVSGSAVARNHVLDQRSRSQ